MHRFLTVLWLALSYLMLVGCGVGPLGPEFKSTFTSERIRSAFNEALISNDVLIPAIGAGIMAIDDFDQKVSDWAVKHNPIYGSPDSARSTSDALRDAGWYAAGTTWAIRPTDKEPSADETDDQKTSTQSYSKEEKTLDLIVGLATIGKTYIATAIPKELANRERPDKENDESFPSGHSSTSAASAMIARHHLKNNDSLPQGVRDVGGAALVALPYATGWARIEGQKHYPSDVLAGIAIGNFFAIVANKLIDRPENRKKNPLEPRTMFYAAPGYDGKSLVLGFSIEF